MDDVRIENCCALPLLCLIEPQEIAGLEECGELEHFGFHKGCIVHLPGEPCLGIDILTEGKLSLQDIDESGNSLILSMMSAPAVIGTNILFSEEHGYPFTVTSLTDVQIIRLAKQTVLRLCGEKEAFLYEVLRSASEHTELLTQKLHALTFKSIRAKMVDFIKTEIKRQHSMTIRLPMNKTELAESMGIRRSSLGREITNMREEGILDFDNHTITVLNYALLDSDHSLQRACSCMD